MDEARLIADLEANPGNAVAARAITALFERQKRWRELADHLVARVPFTPDRREQAGVLEHAAEVLEEKLGDHAGAFEQLRRAFVTSHSDIRYGRRLARLAEAAGRWDALLDAYERSCSEDPKSLPIRRRLADWYVRRDRLTAAAEQWRAILVYDPENVTVARSYEAYLAERADWPELIRHLRQRARTTTDLSGQTNLLLRVARVQESELDDWRSAMQTLGEAFTETLDSGIEAELERLATTHDVWPEVVATLAEAWSDRDDESAAEGQAHIGRIYELHLMDKERAIEHYWRAFQIDAENERSSSALRRLLTEQERWEDLAPVLAREASASRDREDRFQKWLALGDLYRDHLGLQPDAVAAWFEALDTRPDDRRVLLRLLESYRSSQKWTAAVKVLKKLARLEADPVRRAELLYTKALIERDELADRDRALRTFDEALDLDPTLLKAFSAIEEVLSGGENYAQQDEYYRRMLARVRDNNLDNGLAVDLANRLAAINRDHLHDDDATLRALAVVLETAPHDVAARSEMASVRARRGDFAGAAEAYHIVLAYDPTNVEALHQLSFIYGKSGAYDAAWSINQLLVVLRAANEEEQHLYAVGRQGQKPGASRAMDLPAWQIIVWPGRPEAIDVAMMHAYPAVGPYLASNPKALKLHAYQPRSATAFTQVLQHLCEVLGVPAPPLWLDRKYEGVGTANVSPPGLLIGGSIEKRSVTAVAFLTARQLYLSSQQHIIAVLDNDSEARRRRAFTVLASTIKSIHPQADISPYDPKMVARLMQLPPAMREDMGPRFIEVANLPNLGVDAWLGSLEHTASRLGLLLCNDLDTAVQCIRADPRPLHGTADERVMALLSFAGSPIYFDLRQRLGFG